MPSVIFSKDEIALFRGLVEPYKLVAQINEIQEMRESLQKLAMEYDGDREQDTSFKEGLENYIDFYEVSVKTELLYFA